MRLSLAKQVLFLWAVETDPIKRQIVLLLFKAVLAGTPLLCLILCQVFCPRTRRLRHWSALVNWLWPVGLSHTSSSSKPEAEVRVQEVARPGTNARL